MKQGFKNVATRIDSAHDEFVSNVVEQFGCTQAEAEKVLQVYRKAKAVRLDAVSGVYRLTHGAFWEADVIHRAIAS